MKYCHNIAMYQTVFIYRSQKRSIFLKFYKFYIFYSLYIHVKISQVVTGLLPEQCLNNIVIMCEQHICWTYNIDHLVLTILLSK